jgi:hypothetical protein
MSLSHHAPHQTRQLDENVEIYLLAEENLADSRVFFHETAIFRDPEPLRPGRRLPAASARRISQRGPGRDVVQRAGEG